MKQGRPDLGELNGIPSQKKLTGDISLALLPRGELLFHFKQCSPSRELYHTFLVYHP